MEQDRTLSIKTRKAVYHEIAILRSVESQLFWRFMCCIVIPLTVM